MESDPHVWIAALRRSHDRLVSLIRPLDASAVRGPSYCRDWTIAQVMSHLGSGAEIALMMLPVALGEAEPLGAGAFQPVWDVWNGKSPDDQVADALQADEKHVLALEQLSDAQLAGVNFPFLGLELDAAGLVRLRLGEHALHSWDVAVTADPAAAVAPDAAELLVDNVAAFIAPRLGKPQGEELRYRIITTGPDRDYLLTVTDAVAMTAWPGGAGGQSARQVSMPAEALLRLSYGRLDAGHTPAQVSGDPADLDRLRAVFPGF
ncbi:MAG TPA: maleylpyruvate isomerase family mycothiol-dependent enzyme [Streptosporangiaceae bacterium]|jgi:uncharacterized protein (TIGR03083 family)